jgi:hypothetical protein
LFTLSLFPRVQLWFKFEKLVPYHARCSVIDAECSLNDANWSLNCSCVQLWFKFEKSMPYTEGKGNLTPEDLLKQDIETYLEQMIMLKRKQKSVSARAVRSKPLLI